MGIDLIVTFKMELDEYLKGKRNVAGLQEEGLKFSSTSCRQDRPVPPTVNAWRRFPGSSGEGAVKKILPLANDGHKTIKKDHKKLQRVVNEAQSITQTSLPSIDSVYASRCLGKAASVIKDPTHPGHTLFHWEKDTKV